MRRLLLVLLIACGGKQAPPAGGGKIVIGNDSAAPDAATAYDPSGCTPQPGITAESCAAQGEGCQVSAHPFCSGVQQPDDEYERARHGPCACVCPEEILRCSEVP